MESTEKKTVPFDPGFDRYSAAINLDLVEQVKSIRSIKSQNQRSFQLRLLESQLIKPIETTMCIYYGCVIYGSILAAKYQSSPTQIEGNHILELPEEDREQIDLAMEPVELLDFYTILEKNIQFNLKRKSKLPEKLEYCTKLYIDFVIVNNHFKTLERTDQIKLPPETMHFYNYSKERLDTLEKEVFDITTSGELTRVLNIS